MKSISNKEYQDLLKSIPVVLASMPMTSDIKLENAKRSLRKFIIKNK